MSAFNTKVHLISLYLQIEDIDIRGNADCYGDYLEVYGGSKKPHLMCGKGRRITSKVTSKGDSLRLVFNTDELNNGRGFRAVFTALFPGKCRQTDLPVQSIRLNFTREIK